MVAVRHAGRIAIQPRKTRRRATTSFAPPTRATLVSHPWAALVRMSAINRYILFELIKVTMIALFGMTAVLIFSDVVKELQNRGLGVFQIVQALPFLLPYAVRTSLQVRCCLPCAAYSGGCQPPTRSWPSNRWASRPCRLPGQHC